ncbi:nucleotidyl transferase AbiEii/AbiGii toxin family protein [Rhizobium sp. NXC24]|nr:nucleotidyl transferase AbiEii/AbiGii toxin family protein [Rhizobium sp. NXC24]
MIKYAESKWADLFDQATSIIDQANREFNLIDSWTFGGGTALMLQIDHRESFDVDIFVQDPQLLPYLNPQTQGYELDISPDG